MGEFKSWNSYRDFSQSVRHRGRFVRSKEDDEFLKTVLATSGKRVRRLSAGFGLARAQLGHDWRPHYQDDEYVTDVACAFPPERMKPIPHKAKEGRVNPLGIPCLYLATPETTAMSEVRPWIGSLVSCGHFRIKRDLNLIDFTLLHDKNFTFYFDEPDATKKEEAVWAHIDRAFSEPVTSSDDVADYAPTQIIAEMFKAERFDGVSYKSAFGERGYNIALFNLDDAELTSCALHRVKSAEFTFNGEDNPYWVENDGTKTRLELEIIPQDAIGAKDPDPT